MLTIKVPKSGVFRIHDAMNTTATPPPPPARQILSKRRMAWIVAGAIALGLLLFLMLMLSQRNHKPFYSAGPDGGHVDQNGQVQVFEPLPSPLPAGEGNQASRLPDMAEANRNKSAAQIIEPPRRAPESMPSTAPVRNTPAAAPVRSSASSAPVPIRQPAPRYPRNALRSGIEGTVQVLVDVGPDGTPTSVSLAAGSGNRELDRAALDAVRRWRFTPAMANGLPTVGRVTVPIQFSSR